MKRLGIFTFICCVAFFGVMNVHALSINGQSIDTAGNDANREITKDEDGTYNIKLLKDVAYDIELITGDDVVIDLNGHKLTNSCKTCSPIWIKPDATLTITDNSESRNGTITYSDDATANDNYYASLIRNEGILNFEDGIVDVNKGGDSKNQPPYAIGIDNLSELHIIGGEIKTSHSNAWGLNNQATGFTDIMAATFTQGSDFSVIMNHGNMYISNGDFKVAEGNNDANSLITSIGTQDKAAVLNIEDGNFVGRAGIFYESGENDYNTISLGGGNYTLADGSVPDLSAYIPEGYTMDEYGNVVREKSDSQTSTENNTNSSSSNEKANKKANLDDVPKTGVIYSVINYLA